MPLIFYQMASQLYHELQVEMENTIKEHHEMFFAPLVSPSCPIRGDQFSMQALVRQADVGLFWEAGVIRHFMSVSNQNQREHLFLQKTLPVLNEMKKIIIWQWFLWEKNDHVIFYNVHQNI